ncbi:acyl-CoA dehydrogenase family protein [Natronomonas gomsonensis]|uniref:acyl-CoA dehydrogenase family protein n=1 Tax=Natronomonas gomsonensis TaxID=1046043 RepID=UPI0020CA5000|nr:acyl-CoA dehydrogenase family protein [Natronomonas gomsonensis]MCY4731570.1 acyl-CoA dehydrogenase family protein [Natronomonas gomsonensis]
MRLTDEQQFIQKQVRTFATEEIEPIAVEYEHDGTYPWDVVGEAAEMDLLAPGFPETVGGAGMDLVTDLIVNEELHRADPGIGETVTSITFGCESILEYGTEEQIERYVEPATAGEKVSAVAMTEPEAGSDFANIQTTAERDGDEYVLNGDKVFISNGSVADFIVVYARTGSPDEPHKGISAFIVDADVDGFEATPMDGYLGPSTTDLGQLFLSDVRVPVEARLGEEGQGFYQAMEFLDEGRLSVAVSAVGAARGALDLLEEYIDERQAFGAPISDNQAVRHRVANLRARLAAARALVYDTAKAVESDEPVDTERAAMAKLVATTLFEDVASEAVQLHGGYGCFDEYRVETFFRFSKIPQIYEGTNEIMREVIGDATFD